jgi:hypothetical protein
MVMTPFPYRAIGCDVVATDLRLRTERIKQLLEAIGRAAAQIGEDVEWALESLRCEIYIAWLFSEFRWTPAIGDGFAEASALIAGNRTDPGSALRITTALTGRSIAGRELIRVKELLQSYRAILRGDGSIHHRSYPRKPRSSIKYGRPRVRSRVFRDARRIPPLERDDCDE